MTKKEIIALLKETLEAAKISHERIGNMYSQGRIDAIEQILSKAH